MFNTPILFLVFNRLDTTKIVFEKLRELKPKQLFIAADGHRTDHIGEKEICDEVRIFVTSNIDWECELKTLFRNENKGCGKAVSEAISWFFENVDEGIILEDDCLPSISFFTFCEEMLIKHRNNSDIWHISGTWFLKEENNNSTLTKFPLVWGWATWKRSWKNYDFHLYGDTLSEIETVVYSNLKSKEQTDFWMKYFKILFVKGWNFTWDFQWIYTIWKHNGLSISTTRNYISNIGFTDNATHTKDSNNILANFPISENNYTRKNKLSKLSPTRERRIFNYYFLGSPPQKKLVRKFIKKILRNIGYNILNLILPEISNLKRNIDWNFIEYSISENFIGENVKIIRPAHISSSKIENFTYISQNVWMSETSIGKFCSIGPNFFCGWGTHPTNGISTSPMFYSTEKQNGITFSKTNKIKERKRITIGNDVFIGANVTILDGVSIGDGAIIGAGAIVSKDIPPFAIAVGSPIRILRYRFESHQIESLLKIKWWNFPDENLKDVEKMFFDIDNFIAKYE